jgi:PKD repeat protein
MKHRFLVVALAAVMLTVLGAVHAESTQAQAQVAPVANTGGPYTGATGTAITFNGSLSSGVGLSYQWNFGDGTGATGAIVTHAYAAAGTYTVTLTVTDSLGQTSTATTTATVTGAAQSTCFFSFGTFVCTPVVGGTSTTISCAQTVFGLVCTPVTTGVAGAGCVLTTAGLVCGGLAPRTVAVIIDGTRAVFCPVPNISTGCPLPTNP